MMSMDITALGAAPAPPGNPCAPAETPDAAAGFSAMLDEAAGTGDEPVDLPSDPGEGDADDEDALAALAMTSLLSIETPVAKPVETFSDEGCSATGEISEGAAIDQVPSPDALMDVSAESGSSEAAEATEENQEGPELPAALNAKGQTATTKADDPLALDAESAKSIVADVPANDGDVTNANGNATRGDTEPTTRTDVNTAATKAARAAKPSRGHAKAAQATSADGNTHAAQAIAAAVVNQSATETSQASGRGNAADTQVPTSAAARFARALERAASLNGIESTPVEHASAGNDSGAGESPSFGEGKTDRESQPGAAPRHANGGVSFTVAAPSFDARTLARAVDAASHVAGAPAMTIPERDVVAQLVQSLRVQFRDGIGEAVVKLKPEHLGSVQVSLKIDNGAITATVQAEVASVRHWLESQQDTLRTSLAEQGLRLERFVVEPDGERRTREDAQPREQRRRQQRARENAGMSAKDQPVFEVTV